MQEPTLKDASRNVSSWREAAEVSRGDVLFAPREQGIRDLFLVSGAICFPDPDKSVTYIKANRPDVLLKYPLKDRSNSASPFSKALRPTLSQHVRARDRGGPTNPL